MDDLHDSKDNLAEIVNNLIDGMPLTKIPDDLHPQLLIPLSAAKNEEIVTGNQQKAKKIQKIMRQLNLNPNKKFRTNSQVQNRTISRNSSNLPKSNEYESLVNILLDGASPDSIECDDYRKLVDALKSRKQQYLNTGDYHKTQILENHIQIFNTKVYESAYEKSLSDQITQLNLQKNQAESDLETAKQFWADSKSRYDEERAEALEELRIQQDKQLEDFDNSFPEVLPANYRKVSSKVLNLREQEKHLVLTKRYEEAIGFRKQADMLEQQELERQREKFQIAFEQQRQHLMATQKNQLRCFNANWDRKLEKLLQERDNEEKILKRTINTTQVKISKLEDESKGIPISRPISTISSGTSSHRSSSQVTPRVRSVATSRNPSRTKYLVRKVQRNESYLN